MSLLSLIVVFLIEQFKPLDYRRVLAIPLSSWATFVEARFNAGARQQGKVAWCLAVLLPVLVVGVLYLLLNWLNAVLGWLFSTAVLYLMLGFRQFSHHFTEIQLALRLGELGRARQLLADWQGCATDDMSETDVARQAIEAALVAAHRHVFAIILCFLLLPGPCGPVLYRLALIVRDRWTSMQSAAHNEFAVFAQRAFALIDWLPLRTTAAFFAVVGNFEDAVHCWRSQAVNWPDRDLGIVLASGAGALGVRLGGSVLDGLEMSARSELGGGEPADVDFMQSAVGLVWRATVLWVLLLFLLGLASLAG